MKRHIDQEQLTKWKNETFTRGQLVASFTVFSIYPFSMSVVLGLVILGFALVAACVEWRPVSRYFRFKKELALLKQDPCISFAEMGRRLNIDPQKVRADIIVAIERGVLRRVRMDETADRLRYRRPASVAAETQISVTCPHCGAACTVSSVSGGQCEYCDSHLPGAQ